MREERQNPVSSLGLGNQKKSGSALGALAGNPTDHHLRKSPRFNIGEKFTRRDDQANIGVASYGTTLSAGMAGHGIEGIVDTPSQAVRTGWARDGITDGRISIPFVHNMASLARRE